MLARVLASLDTQALLQMAARQIGVPLATLQAAIGVAEDGAAAAGAPVFAIDVVRSLIRGDKSSLSQPLSILRGVLAEESMWPALATSAVDFVASHPSGAALEQVVSKISKLPIVGFTEKHNDMQDFMLRGLFPRLREWMGVDLTCKQCSAVAPVVIRDVDGSVFCSSCLISC